jgi:hypothetical protein
MLNEESDELWRRPIHAPAKDAVPAFFTHAQGLGLGFSFEHTALSEGKAGDVLEAFIVQHISDGYLNIPNTPALRNLPGRIDPVRPAFPLELLYCRQKAKSWKPGHTPLLVFGEDESQQIGAADWGGLKKVSDRWAPGCPSTIYIAIGTRSWLLFSNLNAYRALTGIDPDSSSGGSH